MDLSFVENDQSDQNNQNTTQKKKGGSQKRSWVWEWFASNSDGTATCQVEVVVGEICGKLYKHKGSTGVLMDHLNNKHQITKGITKQDYVVRNKIN